MGIETNYVATVTKTCDGCGERWQAQQTFSSVALVLAYGGPIEAADWEFYVTHHGVHMLCKLCAAHHKAGL